MNEICRNCGEPIKPHDRPELVKIGGDWYHVKTGMMRCEHYAEPLPPKMTRQERVTK